MKALLATMAIVVIATCGYFVYDDYQSKAAEAKAIAAEAAARAELESRVNCLTNLRELKAMLEGVNMWDGKTHKERMETFKTHPRFTKYSNLLSESLDYYSKECG